MSTMTNEATRYFSYLLRLWCVDVNGEAVWRASLEDSHTGERHGFADLDRLYAFLQERTHDFDRSRAVEVNACP